jgi:hypothetical protein
MLAFTHSTISPLAMMRLLVSRNRQLTVDD